MPQLTVPTFNDLPLPINSNIKAVVLDKDNCFAIPKMIKYGQLILKMAISKATVPGKETLDC